MSVRVKKQASASNGASAVEYAEAQVAKEGFSLPKRPGEEVPRIPDDLTTIDDISLMNVMREQLAWVEYAGYRLARGEIEERELDFRINQRLSFLMVSQWGGGREDRVTIAKAESEGDREIKRLREQHLKAMAYRKLINNLYDAADRRVQLVSRELTRRISMEPAQRRDKRWGKG